MLKTKGNIATIMMSEKIKTECQLLEKLLINKNKKYGDSFTKTANEYGNVVLVLRIEDKLNRLKQLLLNNEPDTLKGENVLDTLLDLAGYSLLAKIYLQNKR